MATNIFMTILLFGECKKLASAMEESENQSSGTICTKVW